MGSRLTRQGISFIVVLLTHKFFESSVAINELLEVRCIMSTVDCATMTSCVLENEEGV